MNPITTELDIIDTFIDAPIDEVVAFLTDLSNIPKFAYQDERKIEIEFLAKRKIKGYDSAAKTVGTHEYKLLRKEDVAILDLTSHFTSIDGEELVWNTFLVVREWGEQSHVLFGWYNTPEIKEYLKKMQGWSEFDSDFIKITVASKELATIKKIIEEDIR